MTHRKQKQYRAQRVGFFNIFKRSSLNRWILVFGHFFYSPSASALVSSSSLSSMLSTEILSSLLFDLNLPSLSGSLNSASTVQLCNLHLHQHRGHQHHQGGQQHHQGGHQHHQGHPHHHQHCTMLLSQCKWVS